MGDFFQVDLDVLQRFITSLRDSGDHMESALNALKAAESGKIGTDELDDAADDFQGTWRYGLGQLREKIKETNEGVSAVHKTYRETEQSVTDSLRQMTRAISGGA